MPPHKFFAMYANTPLNDRVKIINFGRFGTMTLSDLYARVQQIEDKIRPEVIERDSLLSEANWYFANLAEKSRPN